MFLKRTSVSERHSTTSHLIAQGLRSLQGVASRIAPSSEERLRWTPHGPSKLALATCRGYRKMNVPKAVPSLSGFASEMEELRKAFLLRPDCPQFSTKSTSVSHLGSVSSIDLPRALSGCSKTWKGTEGWLLDMQDSDKSMDGRPLLGSKSARELGMQRRSSAPTLSPVSSCPVPGQRLPWYISVIHEKDRSLMGLGEKIKHFSMLETEVQKKDQEILTLRREMEALRKQLKCVVQSKAHETPPFPSRTESALEAVLTVVRPSILKTTHIDQEDLPHLEQVQEEDALAELSSELSLELEGSKEDQGPGPGSKGAEDAGARDSVSRTGAVQEEGTEEEEKELEEEDEEDLTQEGDSTWGQAFSMTESFEDELLAQLEEYERTLLELQGELEATRIRYCLATGAIASLQRQVTFQESQVRKVNTENEALQKELQERKQQLQAMSDKFSRLREDKKHQEMMGLIEKDNLDLRQRVSDLERELAKRDITISELAAKVSKLQAQVGLEQDHGQRWKQLQEDLRGRNESLQQAEQQARAALESAQARLERLRSKIMQAAFSVMGVKALAGEISDNDILEALQRIISERNDYYHQLKQTGVKVPPPQQVEILPSKSKKVLPK